MDNKTPVYYIAQESAMAPGIVKEWPEIIKHPKDKNGRLKKINLENMIKTRMEQVQKEIDREGDYHQAFLCGKLDGYENILLMLKGI